MSNVSNEYNEALLEPLKYYREELKDAFQQVTEEYFQQLVDQSKIDIDNNKLLIDKYTDVSEIAINQTHPINDLALLKRLILLLV